MLFLVVAVTVIGNEVTRGHVGGLEVLWSSGA